MGFMSFMVNYVFGFGFLWVFSIMMVGLVVVVAVFFYGWWLWVVILIWFLFCFYFLFGFVGMDLAVVAIDAGGFFFFSPYGIDFWMDTDYGGNGGWF